MRINRLAVAALAIAAAPLFAAFSAHAATNGIDADRLAKHVNTLASDSMGGRGAGYPGEAAAAAYIADTLQRIGLAPMGDVIGDSRSFYQSFDFHPREPVVPWETLTTRNVIAVLPGRELSEEIVVIGAHHDGQGMTGQANAGRFTTEDSDDPDDTIWNSASDNATSVAALLEIARVLVESGTQLRRTVVFVTFSAEEYSLNGAVEYVRRPPLSWDRHVAMINLEKLVGDPDIEFITATSGSSPAFETISPTASVKSGIAIRSFYPGLVTDTDHYPFVARGVPGIVIGTGSYINIHERNDEAGRLDYALLKERTDFVLRFLVEAANHDGAFEFTGDAEGYFGVMGSPATDAELRARDLDPANIALKVSSVIPGMNGDLAGILPGDLVTEIDGSALEDNGDGYFTLFDIVGEDPPEVFELTIVRQNSATTLRVRRD